MIAIDFLIFFILLGLFTVVVVTIFLFQFRRIRSSLLIREQEMTRRMYQLSILRELGERIGYSLRIDHIVEIIAGSLQRLLEYSTVAYMLQTTSSEGKAKINFKITLEKPVHKAFIESVKQRMLDAFNTILGSSYTLEDVEETVSGTITDPQARREIGSFFNVPIVIAGSPVGLLTISDTRRGAYTGQDAEILYTIMSQASDAVSKLQRVLKIEETRLNSTVASMADGVLMIDKQKQLSIINPTARRMLGLSAERVSIFDVLDVLATQFDLRAKLEESIAHDDLIVVPTITMRGQVLQVLISPVKDEQSSFLGAVVLFHDITKEKEVEKLREDFTSMMVHELRSPLTGIKSIAGLLLNSQVKSNAQKYNEFVSLITKNSQDMLGLVNDLMDVAKLESGKFQLLKKLSDIAAVVSASARTFEALASQSSITLQVVPDEGLPKSLEFDEHKMGQVLNNLISNALKFTGAGGTVKVTAFILPKAADLADYIVKRHWIWPGIKRGVHFAHDRLIIAVTDTGTGLAEQRIPSLFNKFVQLENAARSEKKGTGLGLVIVKGIMEAHEGGVGVFSEEGEGTTFYVSLPLS